MAVSSGGRAWPELWVPVALVGHAFAVFWLLKGLLATHPTLLRTCLGGFRRAKAPSHAGQAGGQAEEEAGGDHVQLRIGDNSGSEGSTSPGARHPQQPPSLPSTSCQPTAVTSRHVRLHIEDSCGSGGGASSPRRQPLEHSASCPSSPTCKRPNEAPQGGLRDSLHHSTTRRTGTTTTTATTTTTNTTTRWKLSAEVGVLEWRNLGCSYKGAGGSKTVLQVWGGGLRALQGCGGFLQVLYRGGRGRHLCSPACDLITQNVHET